MPIIPTFKLKDGSLVQSASSYVSDFIGNTTFGGNQPQNDLDLIFDGDESTQGHLVYANALGGTGEITFNPPVTIKAGETLRVKYSRRCKPVNNEASFTYLYIYSNDTALLSLTDKPANDNETLDIFEFTASQDTELTLIRASAASAYSGTGVDILVGWNF